MIRTIIADDEPVARNLLREMLDARGGIEIVAEASDGRAAVAAILEHRPQLVFLDIQMPELDGFAVVDRLGAEHAPAIVFVTAFDRYALRAFDVDALDYLLKPFDAERLDRTVTRALARLRDDGPLLTRSIADLLERYRSLATPAARIPVTLDGRVRFVPVANIDWLQADGKNVRIYAGGEVITVRQTLQAFATQLDPQAFLRVHRSAIVRTGAVHEAQPWFHGDYVLILRNGTKVTTGRAYRDAVRQFLETGR